MSAPPIREPSGVALGAAQLVLLVWLALLTAADQLGAQSFEAGARAASPTGAAVLGALGFVVPAVLAMFPRLAPGLLGLGRPPRKLAIAASAVGGAMGGAALLWAATGAAEFVGAQGVLGFAGGLMLVATVVLGRRARRTDLPLAPPSAHVALPANLLVVGALAYLLAGCALLAVVAFFPGPTAAMGLAPSVVWPLHLVTAGFAALAVFGIGVRMFGAFAGVEAPPAAVWVIAAAGLTAPLGIAAGLARYDYGMVAIFGSVGLVASGTFAGVVLWMGRAHTRRFRPAWYLLLAGALSLVAGEALGALFGASPGLLGYAALHGQTNILGFAGLTVFGVLFFLSGGDGARPDVIAPGVWIAALWPAALALRAIGTVAGTPPAVVLADAVLLASYLVAARTVHPRRPGRPPRP